MDKKIEVSRLKKIKGKKHVVRNSAKQIKDTIISAVLPMKMKQLSMASNTHIYRS